MDSPCIKQSVCKVLEIFQYGKYLVAYVLNETTIRKYLFDNLWRISLRVFFQNLVANFDRISAVLMRITLVVIGNQVIPTYKQI